MKTNKSRLKKLIPLFASLSILSGPVIFVAGCGTDDITRYPAGLPNNVNNRILFSFAGVNYYVTAKNQFDSDYSSNISFIKQKVEYIMGQQKLYEFFHDKLNYDQETAMNTVETVVNQIGLNVLAKDYTDALNKGSTFDTEVNSNNNLILQTQSWNTFGSTKLNYDNFPAFKNLNPDNVFTIQNLTKDLDNSTITDNMNNIINTTDQNFSDIAKNLLPGATTWDTPSSIPPICPTWSEANSKDPTAPIATQQKHYQTAVNRFKLWLRFRYQQYYQTKILPDLGQSIFTMAYLLDSMFNVKANGANPTISFGPGKYSQQLQTWDTSTQWTSNYHLAFDYTTNKTKAVDIEKNWNNPIPKQNSALPDMIKPDPNATGINQAFVDLFRGSNDDTVDNGFDPIFGINSATDGTGRPYASALTFTSAKTTAGWITNGTTANSHYWVNNNNASFVYVAPIYFMDVISNLNFNYYNQKVQNSITPTFESNLANIWTSGDNATISSSPLSTYIRNGKSTQQQDVKWNLFWQMLYSLADQTNSKSSASDNFNAAAPILYPEYIKKVNVYDKAFWDAISSYYNS